MKEGKKKRIVLSCVAVVLIYIVSGICVYISRPDLIGTTEYIDGVETVVLYPLGYLFFPVWIVCDAIRILLSGRMPI